MGPVLRNSGGHLQREESRPGPTVTPRSLPRHHDDNRYGARENLGDRPEQRHIVRLLLVWVLGGHGDFRARARLRVAGAEKALVAGADFTVRVPHAGVAPVRMLG